MAVKPLEWHPGHGCTANGLGIHYAMSEGTPGLYSLHSPFYTTEELPQEEVQAIAQAHFEESVMSVLIPSGPDERDLVEIGTDFFDEGGKCIGRAKIVYPPGNTKESRIKFLKDMILIEEAIDGSTLVSSFIESTEKAKRSQKSS